MEACHQSGRSLTGYSLPPPPPPPQMAAPLCPHALPPPRIWRHQQSANSGNLPWWRTWMKKYIILCLMCGGLSVLLGIIFIGIYFTLRSYTSSLQFFETVPTYVPAVVLIVTGLIVMCFAKRRNRYAYLIKVAGVCCLICALLCVVITVTTTVVHMNRLQTLHECVYTPKAKTCMCISAMADLTSLDGAHHFVFNNTPNCEVVHGSLYACLRALFGLSVIGILVCIFSSMLVYQLLTHERKKMYWEQLEVRRRFLHRRSHHHHHTYCNCYEDMYPWQLWELLDYRFLNTHPLSPGPGLDETSPGATNMGYGNNTPRASAWNWLPWSWHTTLHRSQRSGGGGFISHLLARERCSSEDLASSVPSPQESPVHPDGSGFFPWRSEFLQHMFRQNSRSANGIPPVHPPRFGVRSRPSGHGHRRTRSNDGVFHHLQMNPSVRLPPHAYPPHPDGANMMPYQFASYDIPHYMWGPPPPYSRPPSMENVASLEVQLSGQQDRVSREQQQGSAVTDIHATNNTSSAVDGSDRASSHSSKISTPLVERRLVCSNFSTDGITLTIGSNYSDVCSQNSSSMVNEGFKRDDTCIVEVHVPVIVKRQEVVFNTLPTRSSRKNNPNLFTSLSNIPLCLSKKRGKNALHEDSLSVIETVCETKEEEDEEDDSPYYSLDKLNDIKNILCDTLPTKVRPAKVLYESSHSSVATDSLPSTPTFHPTIVQLPSSDFKSSIVIATSPSTPVTENATMTEMVYAHSMPNLSLSSSPTLCRICRVPSSGNTSTSQDFADFELEEDSMPVDTGSTLLRDSPLPDDEQVVGDPVPMTTSTSSSSSPQNSHPKRCFGRCHSTDTSSGSPAYYCLYRRAPLGAPDGIFRGNRILLSSSFSSCSRSTTSAGDNDLPLDSSSSSPGHHHVVAHEPPSAFRNTVRDSEGEVPTRYPPRDKSADSIVVTITSINV